MANVKVEGLDELIKDMERLGAEASATFEKMLEAGADETVDAWKRAIEKHGHMDTGELYNKVKWQKSKQSKGSLTAEIYPGGTSSKTTAPTKSGKKTYTRRKKVRQAEKAFVLHYGTKSKPGSYFIDDAVEDANQKIPDKLKEIWDQYIKGGK